MDVSRLQTLHLGESRRSFDGPLPGSGAAAIKKPVIRAGQAHLHQQVPQSGPGPMQAHGERAQGNAERNGNRRPPFFLKVDPPYEFGLSPRHVADHVGDAFADRGVDFGIGFSQDVQRLGLDFGGHFPLPSARRFSLVIGKCGGQKPTEPAAQAGNVAQVISPRDRPGGEILHHVHRVIDVAQAADQEAQKPALVFQKDSLDGFSAHLTVSIAFPVPFEARLYSPDASA